jgi:hypothetical protein
LGTQNIQEKNVRKIIEITPEFEKTLVTAIDVALKQSGIAVMQLVQTITSAIKVEGEETPTAE